MKKDRIVDIISSLFIVLFLYTGINKLFNQSLFKFTLYKLHFLDHHQEWIAWFIPLVELLIAASLLIPLFKENHMLRKWGLMASFILMAIFTLYVGYMLKYVQDLPCSCGGIIQKLSWHQHLYFNALFSVFALLGMLLNREIAKPAGRPLFTS